VRNPLAPISQRDDFVPVLRIDERTQQLLESRYISLLRLAWRVGWLPARAAYVHDEALRGREAEEVRNELAFFDMKHYRQSETGVDPIAALRQHDIVTFVTRPMAVLFALGIAALSAATGFEALATVAQASVAFAFADAGARTLVRLAVR
jgi:hypothetical protein